MRNPFPDRVVDEYNDDSPDKTRERYRFQQKLCKCGFAMKLESNCKGEWRAACSRQSRNIPSVSLDTLGPVKGDHDTVTAWADSPEAAWLAWQAVYILTH